MVKDLKREKSEREKKMKKKGSGHDIAVNLVYTCRRYIAVAVTWNVVQEQRAANETGFVKLIYYWNQNFAKKINTYFKLLNKIQIIYQKGSKVEENSIKESIGSAKLWIGMKN